MRYGRSQIDSHAAPYRFCAGQGIQLRIRSPPSYYLQQEYRPPTVKAISPIPMWPSPIGHRRTATLHVASTTTSPDILVQPKIRDPFLRKHLRWRSPPNRIAHGVVGSAESNVPNLGLFGCALRPYAMEEHLHHALISPPTRFELCAVIFSVMLILALLRMCSFHHTAHQNHAISPPSPTVVVISRSPVPVTPRLFRSFQVSTGYTFLSIHRVCHLDSFNIPIATSASLPPVRYCSAPSDHPSLWLQKACRPLRHQCLLPRKRSMEHGLPIRGGGFHPRLACLRQVMP